MTAVIPIPYKPTALKDMHVKCLEQHYVGTDVNIIIINIVSFIILCSDGVNQQKLIGHLLHATVRLGRYRKTANIPLKGEKRTKLRKHDINIRKYFNSILFQKFF